MEEVPGRGAAGKCKNRSIIFFFKKKLGKTFFFLFAAFPQAPLPGEGEGQAAGESSDDLSSLFFPSAFAFGRIALN